MNDKFLKSLADIARSYPQSVETILKIAYAAGKFDGAYLPPVRVRRYVQPEHPEMAAR
jgi:hypothetical protein